jgi:hypothetical protein
MRSLIYQTYFFFSYLLGFGQTAPLESIADLAPGLTECSGMAAIGSNAIAMINDSGNKPELFVVDSTGQLIYRSLIPGVENQDWEALAYGNGILYIGDIGNNANRRKDLLIYALNVEHLLDSGKMNLVKKIPFQYQRQKNFPPAEKSKFFDAEALFYFRSNLYLVSKNRSQPFNGYAYLYQIPLNDEDLTLSPLDSVALGKGLKQSHWVTGATIDQNGRLILLGYDKYWQLDHFNGKDLSGQWERIYFNKLSQKEAVAFMGDQLWVAEEERKTKPQLYRVGQVGEEIRNTPLTTRVMIENKIVSDELLLNIKMPDGGDLRWEIFKSNGERLSSGKLNLLAKEKHKVALDLSDLEGGSYILNVIIYERPYAFLIEKQSQSLPAKVID